MLALISQGTYGGSAQKETAPRSGPTTNSTVYPCYHTYDQGLTRCIFSLLSLIQLCSSIAIAWCNLDTLAAPKLYSCSAFIPRTLLQLIHTSLYCGSDQFIPVYQIHTTIPQWRKWKSIGSYKSLEVTFKTDAFLLCAFAVL